MSFLAEQSSRKRLTPTCLRFRNHWLQKSFAGNCTRTPDQLRVMQSRLRQLAMNWSALSTRGQRPWRRVDSGRAGGASWRACAGSRSCRLVQGAAAENPGNRLFRTRSGLGVRSAVALHGLHGSCPQAPDLCGIRSCPLLAGGPENQAVGSLCPARRAMDSAGELRRKR